MSVTIAVAARGGRAATADLNGAECERGCKLAVKPGADEARGESPEKDLGALRDGVLGKRSGEKYPQRTRHYSAREGCTNTALKAVSACCGGPGTGKRAREGPPLRPSPRLRASVVRRCLNVLSIPIRWAPAASFRSWRWTFTCRAWRKGVHVLA